MTRRKVFKKVAIAGAVLLAMLIAAAIFVILSLSPITFTASDGSSISGWRWCGQIYLDANAFTDGKEIHIDQEVRTVSYAEPVNPDHVRAETEEALTLQFSDETDALKKNHADAVSSLEEQIAEQLAAIEELEARIVELEGTQSAPANRSASSSSAAGTGTGTPSATGSSGNSGSGGIAAGSAEAPVSAPAPAPAPAPAAPSVDAAACISSAISYGQGQGMTYDPGISIGDSGYLNPADISVLAQANVISSLQYCLDKYRSYSPDDPSLVHFNIVQSGNLIYALYQ